MSGVVVKVKVNQLSKRITESPHSVYVWDLRVSNPTQLNGRH